MKLGASQTAAAYPACAQDVNLVCTLLLLLLYMCRQEHAAEADAG